jgi:hypothetical protein
MADSGYAVVQQDNDWIKAYRSLRTHPVVGFLNHDGTVRKGKVVCETMAWLDMCMEANWRDRRVSAEGKMALIERGQLIGGRKKLAARWGWSEDKVRHFFKRLLADGMIEISHQNEGKIAQQSRSKDTHINPQMKTRHPNIVTICNYSVYQAAVEIEDLLNTQINTQATPKQHPLPKKERKEDISPSETTSLQEIPDRLAAAEGDLTPDRIVWGNCAKWLAQKTGKTDRAVKGLIGRWLKIVTHEELLEAFRSARRTGIEDPVPYITAIVSRAEKVLHEKCRRENGRLVVVNGFKAELEQILGASDLDRNLDRINGFIPQAMVGVDLEARIRSEAIKLADIKRSWDRRNTTAEMKLL